MQFFNGKPQLLGRLSGGPTDHKPFKPLSFCMFHGSANGSNMPYQSSEESPLFDANIDGQKLAALRAFSQQKGITTAEWQGGMGALLAGMSVC